MFVSYKKLLYLQGITVVNRYFFMEDIFAIRELGVCKKAHTEGNTAFAYFELKSGKEFKNHDLRLNYILFVIDGELIINCNEFEDRKLRTDEMIFMLRSSMVNVRALKDTKLYVMYFDTFISSCDRQFFRAYLPDVEKTTYDFSPVSIPDPINIFFKQLMFLQEKKVNCMHFNSIKHQEFFILLRNFCPREDIIGFLAPLISHSLTFRNKVLEKYMLLKSGRVSELAELIGMGRKNFDKRFHEEFGTSPAKWLLEEKAKRLRLFLIEPGITISDAMDKFNFNSTGHFNRFCHQYFNSSPGLIIKNGKKRLG